MVTGKPASWRVVMNHLTRPTGSSSKQSKCRVGNTISMVVSLSASATNPARGAETRSVSTAVNSRRSSNHSLWSISSHQPVTITPYLSRDTTYCYRHCKGISCFPLLLHHSSPRPMPDWITSASWTFVCLISPYRTHASNPITCTASWTASFLVITIPLPLDVTMTYS